MKDDGFPKLTQTQVESDNLAPEAWQTLLDYLKKRGGDSATIVRFLPQHWRAVYTTFWLDCEVNNGGHHQFFWNSDGALNGETLQDLAYIGAEPYVVIFRDALNIYASHNYQEEKRSSGNTWQAFTQGYREKRLEDCDKRFYQEKKTLPAYLAEHIRRNVKIYCGQ